MSSIAYYTSLSFFLSKALVASSKIKSLGFLIKALARASLYFSPPENLEPAEPTSDFIPSLRALMNPQALVFLRASSIISSVAS